eukprot:Tamp_38826.p2 GENE.Tamp_38826~~Tamp_38826.p2  ORF type:complete len:143 (-),score=31.75 Tamp_38826:70-498(-)
MPRAMLACVALVVLPELALGFSTVRLPMRLRASPALSARSLPDVQSRQVRQRATAPKMMLTSGDGAIFMAEEIFAQVAAGGVALIFSGFLGAFVVGKIVNLEGLEADLQESRTSDVASEATKEIDDDFFVEDGSGTEKEVSK